MSAGVVVNGVKLRWGTLTVFEERAAEAGVHVRDYLAMYLEQQAQELTAPATSRRTWHLTAHERATIDRLTDEGWSIDRIARHIGCASSTVSNRRRARANER